MKLTKEQAKKEAIEYGIEFNKDVHLLSFSDRTFLADLYTRSKYNAPQQRNGSKVRYFFTYLAKI